MEESKSTKTSNKRAFEQFVDDHDEELKLLDRFNSKKIPIDTNDVTCPISKMIFNQPVTANDGFTYERHSIDQILNGDRSKISPITREPLTGYCENKFMSNVVNNLLSEHPEFKQLQFEDKFYNDYSENKKTCGAILRTKNWRKFSNYKEICLQDQYSHMTIILYLSLECNDIESFNKILDNSIDLNIMDDHDTLPIHIICESCMSKDVILYALSKNVDIYNNKTKDSVIYRLYKNKKISNDDKENILSYVIDNNKINLSFVNKSDKTDIHTLLFGFTSGVILIKKLLDICVDKGVYIYQLFGLSTINDAALYFTYDEMIYYLNILENSINTLDRNTVISQYTDSFIKNKYYYSNDSFMYMILSDLNDNEHLNILQKKQVYDRIEDILVNKFNIDELFNCVKNKILNDENNKFNNDKLKLYNQLLENIKKDAENNKETNALNDETGTLLNDFNDE